MPHIVLEYSRGIEETTSIPDLMEKVFDAACASKVMQPEDIKVRAAPYDYYRLREPGETFLHVTLSLLEGRTDGQKEKIAILIRGVLSEALPSVTSLSIDIRDMNAVAYKKRLAPISSDL